MRSTVEYVKNIKKRGKCGKCNKKYHYSQLGFDHITQEEKLGNISRLVWETSLDVVMDELKKTQLLCSNCHALTEWERAEKDKLRHKGSTNGRSKLTEDIVLSMRKEYYIDGKSQLNIAKKYRVNESTARRAITNKTWKHVKSLSPNLL